MAVMRQDDFQRLVGIGVPLTKVFFLHFKEVAPEYSAWINIRETQKAIDEDLRMGEFGAVPQLAEGDVPLFEAVVEGESRRYKSNLFSLGYVITEVAVEDDQYGILGVKLTQALRRSMRHRFEIESYTILNNATSATTARQKGFDGLALLSTAHTHLKAGVADQSNTPSTAADLSSTAIESAVKTFHGWYGENGLPIFTTPRRAILSGQLQYKAARVFRNAMQYDTANHEENWIKQGPDNNGIAGYVPSRYVTNTRAWWLLGDNHDLNLFVRVNPQFRTNVDFPTGNFQAKSRARLISGFGYWYDVYGSMPT